MPKMQQKVYMIYLKTEPEMAKALKAAPLHRREEIIDLVDYQTAIHHGTAANLRWALAYSFPNHPNPKLRTYLCSVMGSIGVDAAAIRKVLGLKPLKPVKAAAPSEPAKPSSRRR